MSTPINGIVAADLRQPSPVPPGPVKHKRRHTLPVIGARLRPNDRGVAYRNHLIVDEDSWPDVHAVLRRDELISSAMNFETKYGLVRVVLPQDYELIAFRDYGGRDLRGRIKRETGTDVAFGRNRILGFGGVQLEVDNDANSGQPKLLGSVAGQPKLLGSVVGQPKLLGSDDAKPEIAAPGVELPRRRALSVGRDITVGVVDSAFFPHPFVAGSTVYGYDDLPSRSEFDRVGAVTGHSTFVSALILAQAPGATVRLARVMSAGGFASSVDVHDAICDLIVAGVDIVNLSLGCYTSDDEAPFVLQHALDFAPKLARRFDRKPPLFVAAAGNFGSKRKQKFWPAGLHGVWSAGSAAAVVDKSAWILTHYSGAGSWVKVVAPGDNVLSAYGSFGTTGMKPDGWAYWGGTSFSAATTSGFLAAELSLSPGARDALQQANTAALEARLPRGVPRVPLERFLFLSSESRPVVGADYVITKGSTAAATLAASAIAKAAAKAEPTELPNA